MKLRANFYKAIESIFTFWKRRTPVKLVKDQIESRYLGAEIDLNVILPPNYSKKKEYPLLLFNDGQDLERMHFTKILEQSYQDQKIADHIIVGVVPKDRIAEYGTVTIKDYKNRGEKSADYHRFLLEELFPFLSRKYKVSTANYQHSIAGFSLGGLSAIYIAWQYPEYFKSVGVFSGALWWRSEPFNPEMPDADRVMHTLVANSEKRKHLKLWFQAGTKDEEADRNNNGVIDAIDDTLHLMEELRNIGYSNQELRYVEIENGEHEPITWGKAMPDFLEWGLN